MNIHDLDNFTIGYIECALWASMDDDDKPLDDNYGPEDIESATLLEMIGDCGRFQKENDELLTIAISTGGRTLSDCGHDLWLTRNRHGAGFWDRGLGVTGEKLTEAAHSYGSFDLYVGDDGKLHGI